MSTTKVSPTKELILVQKARINELEQQATQGHGVLLEYTERLRDFAERTASLRQRLVDADTNYSFEQQRADDLAVINRQLAHDIRVASAQHFTEMKAVKDNQNQDKLWNYAFGIVAGFFAAYLIWGL